jgi:hypothetical protein
MAGGGTGATQALPRTGVTCAQHVVLFSQAHLEQQIHCALLLGGCRAIVNRGEHDDSVLDIKGVPCGVSRHFSH